MSKCLVSWKETRFQLSHPIARKEDVTNSLKRTEFKSGSSCPQEQQFILPCCQNTFSKVSKLDFNDSMFSLTPKPLNCIWKF